MNTHFLNALCSVIAAVFVSLTAFAQAPKPLLVAGPMLGFVEHRSARIWLEVAPEATAVAVEYWQKTKSAEKLRTVYKGQLQQTYNPVSFTLDNLVMNTDYEYAIYVNDILQKPAIANPHFATKELWNIANPRPTLILCSVLACI